MDDIKRCSKCDIKKVLSKFCFIKDKQKYRSDCVQCCSSKRKEWRDNNAEKVKQNQKKYKEQNKEKRNIYLKNKGETDVKFRLIGNTGNKIYESSKGMTKQSSTIDILGIDCDTDKMWLEFQFTPEINWENIEIDHVKANRLFDKSKDEEL